ncbi:MAG: hypothetical protein ACKPKO_22550 [Candidatus Fonsibacter sp.]
MIIPVMLNTAEIYERAETYLQAHLNIDRVVGHALEGAVVL